jgi:hypothetical protein
VGIYLPQPLNDHGKLYVAMSRVRRRADLKLLIIDDPVQFQGKWKGKYAEPTFWYTRNFVIRQIWDFEMPVVPPLPADHRQRPPMAHLEASVN